jgi:hypothetical protein
MQQLLTPHELKWVRLFSGLLDGNNIDHLTSFRRDRDGGCGDGTVPLA